MEASGDEPPPALRNVARRANLADESELPAMEIVLNQNYAALAARRNVVGASKEQLELAQRLGANERPQSFPEWLAAQGSAVNQRDRRLDALMAEIETLDDAEIVQPFRERAAAIAAEASPQRRALLTDSLVLDLSERSRRRRADEVRVEKLREVQVDLRTLGTPQAHAMEARIASILRAAKFDGADNLVAQAQTVIDSEMAKLAAAARRRAVLAGLAKLGYEVRETMSTAWAHDGRLVIRKPNATDYGIELGASPEVTCLSSRRPFRCLDGLRGIPEVSRSCNGALGGDQCLLSCYSGWALVGSIGRRRFHLATRRLRLPIRPAVSLSVNRSAPRIYNPVLPDARRREVR